MSKDIYVLTSSDAHFSTTCRTADRRKKDWQVVLKYSALYFLISIGRLYPAQIYLIIINLKYYKDMDDFKNGDILVGPNGQKLKFLHYAIEGDPREGYVTTLASNPGPTAREDKSKAHCKIWDEEKKDWEGHEEFFSDLLKKRV